MTTAAPSRTAALEAAIERKRAAIARTDEQIGTLMTKRVDQEDELADLLRRYQAAATRHELIVHGSGPTLWGECVCEQPERGRVWAWTGTFEPEQGRMALLRAAFAEHVAFAQANPEYWSDAHYNAMQRGED